MRLTRAMLHTLADSLDPQHQGEQWPDPVAWDGRALDAQARDLLVLADLPEHAEDRHVIAAAAVVRAALPRKRGRKPGPEGARGDGLHVRLSPAEERSFKAAAGLTGIGTWLRGLGRVAAGMDERKCQGGRYFGEACGVELQPGEPLHEVEVEIPGSGGRRERLFVCGDCYCGIVAGDDEGEDGGQ